MYTQDGCQMLSVYQKEVIMAYVAYLRLCLDIHIQLCELVSLRQLI